MRPSTGGYSHGPGGNPRQRRSSFDDFGGRPVHRNSQPRHPMIVDDHIDETNSASNAPPRRRRSLNAEMESRMYQSSLSGYFSKKEPKKSIHSLLRDAAEASDSDSHFTWDPFQPTIGSSSTTSTAPSSRQPSVCMDGSSFLPEEEHVSLLEALESLEEAYLSSQSSISVSSNLASSQQQELRSDSVVHSTEYGVTDGDALLAMALQREEEENLAEAEQCEAAEQELEEESQSDHHRRQLVDQLLNMPLPSPQTNSNPDVGGHQVIEYFAPLSLDDVDQSHYRMVTAISEASTSADENDDLCLICLESLMYGITVSMRACWHIFHLECIDHALEHSKRCPKCRKDVRVEARGISPSGSMSITRPSFGRVTVNGYQNKSIIQIVYNIPNGMQRIYHDSPGDAYNGTHEVAYLPDTADGNQLLKRLIYAFSHGLTFDLGRRGGKMVADWATIPHQTSIADKRAEDGIMVVCNEALDQLGVPSFREDA